MNSQIVRLVGHSVRCHFKCMGRTGYVYILASKKNGTLYTGVTSDLPARLFQHESGGGSKYAAKYGAIRLVWFKEFDQITDAIAEEKRIKNWRRQWKIDLIEAENPDWFDRRRELW